MLPKLFSRQNSIYFNSRGLEIAVLFENRKKYLILSCSHLCVKIFAWNRWIICLLYSSPSQTFWLIQVLCGVGVNIFSSCQVKLDVLHSSHLESFLLVVAIAWHGNACPPLGCPTHTESNKISYSLLAAQSAMPQLSCLHICSIGGLRSILLLANLEYWHRFLSCGLHEQELMKGACFRYVVELPSN